MKRNILLGSIIAILVISNTYVAFLYTALKSKKIINNNVSHNIETGRLSNMPFGKNPKIGSDSSKIKMIVYIDYQCTFSRNFIKNQLPVLKSKYVTTNQLQIIFKDYPLQLNSASITLTQNAHLAYKENTFEEFLLKISEGLTDVSMQEETNNQRSLIEINKEVSNNIFLAGVAGINSTPTFIINNEILNNTVNIEGLVTILDKNL